MTGSVTDLLSFSFFKARAARNINGDVAVVAGAITAVGGSATM
jgi:hypothetical protein